MYLSTESVAPWLRCSRLTEYVRKSYDMPKTLNHVLYNMNEIPPAHPHTTPPPNRYGTRKLPDWLITSFRVYRFSVARILQIADGPDEVHLSMIAKMEIMEQMRKAKL